MVPTGATFEPAAPSRRKTDVAVFVAIAALLVADLVFDALGTSVAHVVLEIVATLFALGAATRIAWGWLEGRRALERSLDDLERRLDTAARDAERWRTEAREALQGLGAAIEKQFERWELTEAEAAVAMLLLKGLSLKEVAGVRGTAERTARQQALTVYRKAGLAGRAELSAFFLEDLLLPSSRPDAG